MNLSKYTKQKAVYWQRTGLTRNGQPSFAEPVEIDCRWDERNENYIDSQGEERTSSAVIMVLQDLTVGGFLKLGLLTDLDSGAGSPITISGAFEINSFTKTPDRKAKMFVRNAYL